MPEEVPARLKEILDLAAGKDHSATGPVMQCLAEVLTEHKAVCVDEAVARVEALRDQASRMLGLARRLNNLQQIARLQIEIETHGRDIQAIKGLSDRG